MTPVAATLVGLGIAAFGVAGCQRNQPAQRTPDGDHTAPRIVSRAVVHRLLRCRYLLAFLLLGGCGTSTDRAPFKELQRTRSGELDVVLLSQRDVVRQGRDSVVLEFRRADGSLVDVGTVRVNASMPMAGMAPMFGGTEIHTADTKGRYIVNTDLRMAGSWRFVVDWDGAGKGSASFSATIR
jgi:YtkA-like protein